MLTGGFWSLPVMGYELFLEQSEGRRDLRWRDLSWLGILSGHFKTLKKIFPSGRFHFIGAERVFKEEISWDLL